MIDEANVLIVTAASIAFVHTLLGPDHYLVIAAMAKARQWSLSKTLRITFYCGAGHVMSSVAIGFAGIFLGTQLFRLIAIETARGSLAAWALIAFGLVYMVWGLRRGVTGHRHTHTHQHGDLVHAHEHDHTKEHGHPHINENSPSVTPWAIFVVFVLGPCESLIPLFMYPAAQQSWVLVLSVAMVFGFVTLATMMGAVTVTTLGLRRLRLPRLGQYAHALAGASIVACGSAIGLLGI